MVQLFSAVGASFDKKVQEAQKVATLADLAVAKDSTLINFTA